MKRIIGLTGGIGTGKTTVSNYLASRYQLPILDADIYAREAVQLGSPVLSKIVQRYGSKVQLPDGTLNRQSLGEIIFSNPNQRHWLEQQIHPYVRDRFLAELDPLATPTVILVVPLLFEAGMTDLVTEIWVVSCSPEQQLKRLMERASQAFPQSHPLSRTQAQARINSQLPIQEKVARADVVLDNSSTPEVLLKQVDFALLYEPVFD
jgi:dephospho-CoA kinase